MCPGLMTIALEKTDVCLLQLCLQQFPDIPEAVTCACLRTFLRYVYNNFTYTSIIDYYYYTNCFQLLKSSQISF